MQAEPRRAQTELRERYSGGTTSLKGRSRSGRPRKEESLCLGLSGLVRCRHIPT